MGPAQLSRVCIQPLVLSAAFVLGAQAQEATPPEKQPVQAAQPTPDLNILLDQLSRIDQDQLRAHLKQLEKQRDKHQEQARNLRKQAERADSQMKAAQRRIDMINLLLQEQAAQPTAQKKPAVKKPPRNHQPKTNDSAKPKPKTKQPAAKMKPAAATEKLAFPSTSKPAVTNKAPVSKSTTTQPSKQPAAPRLTYAKDIHPILVNKCSDCHNAKNAEGQFQVDAYTALMKGGKSGAAIVPGHASDSLLWRVINHEQEPHMPQFGDKLSKPLLKRIRAWIDQGAIENSQPKIPNAQQQSQRTNNNHDAVTALAMSRTEPLIALNISDGLLVANTTSKTVQQFVPFEGRVRDVEFSTDGLWLAMAGGVAGESGAVAVIEPWSGSFIATRTAQRTLEAVAIDGYREFLAYGGVDERVEVFDLLTREPRYELDQHKDWITALEFSPDTTLLASADRSGGLFVWEAESAKLVHILRGHSGAVRDIAFTPNSNWLASIGDDGHVRTWNMRNGKPGKAVRASTQPLQALTILQDGHILLSGSDRRITKWDRKGDQVKQLSTLDDWGFALASGLQDTRALGSWAGQVRIFDRNHRVLWEFCSDDLLKSSSLQLSSAR